MYVLKRQPKVAELTRVVCWPAGAHVYVLKRQPKVAELTRVVCWPAGAAHPDGGLEMGYPVVEALSGRHLPVHRREGR